MLSRLTGKKLQIFNFSVAPASGKETKHGSHGHLNCVASATKRRQCRDESRRAAILLVIDEVYGTLKCFLGIFQAKKLS